VVAATWVIAIASLVNVVVLAVYAYFTWGIWQETRQGAQQTLNLVRQSRDALKAQLMTVVLQGEEAIKARVSGTPAAMNPWGEIRGIRQQFSRCYPDLWREIGPMLSKLPDE
jgi:hypothetical protein